jgi:putative membrane protein
VDTTGTSLKNMQKAINTTTDRLSEMLDKIRELENEDWMNSVLKVMKGDPQTYGAYFAAPVDVNTKEIYPIANYGSAMTPFYTVLALWVGALILTALIKVKADPSKIPGITQKQLYFGRYLFFFVMGQVQALIVVLGDIYFLKCQILNPFAFWLTAAETSFVFTILIYSLTISFGDVGKALAVVIMVIQIAGSGGTYPIELLPEVYRRIYIFFPFPYAINAMRETIGGSYGNTYLLNMLYLLIFAGVGLVIGLVIRKPFVGLNHFMEQRMEDTKMM